MLLCTYLQLPSDLWFALNTAGSASRAAIQDIVQEGQHKAGELAEEAQAAIRERIVKDHHTSQDQVGSTDQHSVQQSKSAIQEHVIRDCCTS